MMQKPEDRLKVTTDALRGGTGVTYERLAPVAAGNLLEANIHVVVPGGEKIDLITHQSEAVGYLIAGEIIDGFRRNSGSGVSRAGKVMRARRPPPGAGVPLHRARPRTGLQAARRCAPPAAAVG